MTEMKDESTSLPPYTAAGVDPAREEAALKQLLYWVNQTLDFPKGGGSVELPSGYFANVLGIGQGQGLAISTDGVGTKVLVAQMAHKYDTIGIDCVAMNVNDVLCVGAEPMAMVDYLAVEEPMPDLLEQIGKGLYEGARRAEISICGGEIAQLKEIVKGVKPGYAFDIAGTCVGLVPLDRVIVGQDIARHDVVIGLRSSGIHSNGLTLARQVLFDSAGLAPDKYFPELGKTLAEELLEPTRIYVPEIKDMLRSDMEVKALMHITGDGFFNLTRVKSEGW
jgi:phosphoribosylformylglycinamidine cyclo-ligase